MLENKVFLYKDLFGSQNLDLAEKVVSTAVRYGCERFDGDYNINYRGTSDFYGNLFSPEQIKFTTQKLIAVGIIESREVDVTMEDKTFKTLKVKVNENKLKQVI